MMKKPECLYRYDAGDILNNKPFGPVLHEFEIIKPTPKGVWILPFKFSLSKKWVSSSSIKRYAYPTKKEAFRAYIIRKMRYIEYCMLNLEKSEFEYRAMKNADEALEHANLIAECDRTLLEDV